MFGLCNKNGFTLIELIITLCILALLLGLAYPSFDKVIERQALASYSRQLAGDIRYVRHRNINGNTMIRIHLTNDRYTIRQGLTILEAKEAPRGVSFLNEIGSYLSFSAHGVPIGMGATTIRLTNSYGHIYEVIIAVNTGRVRFQPHPEKW